ncbi:MAG: helix-hairpin-helix domain-containing protein [Clostridia bacterium]|nr:helix-hairpin-helix domain-containing protein [Clostridia bacterium]
MSGKETIKNIIFFLVIALMLVFLTVSQVYTKREQEKIIGIHIKGAVNNPGYYEVRNGSRLHDVIKKAGGKTSDADLNSVNLAEKVIDGEEIIIPKKGESIDTSQNSNVYYTQKHKFDNENGYDRLSEEIDFEIVNINSADMYQLCRISGIGESTAEEIMTYRKKNGAFKSIEEIKNVKGISEKKFEQIKDKITV